MYIKQKFKWLVKSKEEYVELNSQLVIQVF